MHARPTLRAGVAATVAALGLVLCLPGAGSAKASTTVTTKPATTSAYVANSMRGEYQWLGSAGVPDSYASPDVYYRDSLAWSRLEPTAGTFNFASVDDGLAAAADSGGRFGMRVMAWCPGCWSSTDPNKAWTANEWVPTWLPAQSGDDVPDWNSAAFLDAWDGLWQHLGTAYANDPRLGWIDIGGYGDFGEWHVRRGDEITSANARRMAQAVLDAFPHTHVVVNAMVPSLTNALLALSPRIGLRTDCLGAPDMDSLIATSTKTSPIATRWKTAPVLSEWCSAAGGADTKRGAKQVVTYHVSQVGSVIPGRAYAAMTSSQQSWFRSAARHAGYRYAATSVVTPKKATAGASYPLKLTLKNSGSAPTYDAWDVVLQTLDADGAVVATQDLPVDLRTLLPGSHTYTATVSAPASAGAYRLRLLVRDHADYLAPMALGNTGRGDDGSYPLATLPGR